MYPFRHTQKPTHITISLFSCGGGGVVILYLAQFSITSASLILATFCGVSLFIESCAILYRYMYKKMHFSFINLLNSLGLYGLLCAICVGMWCIAAYYDIHSGRAQYCGNLNLSFGISYAYSSLNTLRGGFYLVFSLVFIAMCIKAIKNRPYAKMLLMQILWLLCLICAYTLLVSKCGAKYYLMSGLLLTLVWNMCVWVAFLLKDIKGARAGIFSFVALVAFLHPFEAYKERPRESYIFYRAYAKSWVESMQEADKNNVDSITIIVPRDFHHWQWEGWFFEGFAHTLRHYGIINRPIKVRFEPDI